MKKLLTNIPGFLALLPVILCSLFVNGQAVSDTIIPANPVEDSLIETIVHSKSKQLPKDQVQYLSQQTKYGFKNLFTSFGYNAALPYSMQVNPKAEVYMQDYLKNHGKNLQAMKSWAMPYFNLIDHILSQYGLPRELKYLAVIESNLKTSATSWVGAAGPWQFMPYTARDYGLLVNGQYDERRDYIKSTHAASRYLLELYRQLRDWLLVIAAYNGGPGRVYEAIKKSGSRNFWNLQYYLPQESRNHVKKFIATHYVMEASNSAWNQQQSFYAAGGKDLSNPYDSKNTLTEEEKANTETQTIRGKYLSVVIAKNLSMDINQFNKYNPGFDAKLSAQGEYDLILPADKMQQFLANKYQILNECVNSILGDEVIPPAKTTYPKAGRKKSP